MAHAFETKLIRGFSFYPPKGSDPKKHLPQAIEQLGQIAETCHRSDLTFGLEIEANLVGQTGPLLAEIHRKVNHPAMVLIFDAANILCQGYNSVETYEQYLAMKPAIGWMHIKDYLHGKQPSRRGHVDEDALKNFVPVEMGAAPRMDSAGFRDTLPKLDATSCSRRGIPGVFLEMEPHVKGGGQFGGFSGPDGLGVALRSLCRTLDFAKIDYHIRDFDDIRARAGILGTAAPCGIHRRRNQRTAVGRNSPA